MNTKTNEMNDDESEEFALEDFLDQVPIDLNTIEDAADAHSWGLTVRNNWPGNEHGLQLFAMAHLQETDNVVYAADYALTLFQFDQKSEATRVAGVVDVQTHLNGFEDLQGYECHRVGLVFSLILDMPYRALPFYEHACKTLPDNTELKLSHGIELNACGYEEEASVIAAAVASEIDAKPHLDETEVSCLIRSANLLANTDPVGAMKVVPKALRFAPESPEVQHSAGCIASKSNDPKAAVAHFQKAIDINPGDPFPHCGLQFALFSLGLFEDAFTLGKEIIKKWPDNIEVRFNNASAASNMGWYTEAEAEFSDILHDDPDDALTHAALGLNYAITGLEQEARDHQAEAMALDGDNPEVQHISSRIDWILDSNRGPTPKELASIFMIILASHFRKRAL